MAGFGKTSPSVILLGQSKLAPDAKDCEAIFPQLRKAQVTQNCSALERPIIPVQL